MKSCKATNSNPAVSGNIRGYKKKGESVMRNYSKYNNKVLSGEEQANTNRRISVVMGGLAKANYPDPIDGGYIAQIDRLEIVPNPETGDPCLYIRMELLVGTKLATMAFTENWFGRNRPMVFQSLPICGTANDAACIRTVTAFTSRLHEDIEIQFNGDYEQFARDIAILRDKIDDYYYLIEYYKGRFNPFSILKIFRAL